MFFGIWGVTVTMPTKLLAKNFPEDVQERLKPRLDELERRGMSRLYEVGMSIWKYMNLEKRIVGRSS